MISERFPIQSRRCKRKHSFKIVQQFLTLPDFQIIDGFDVHISKRLLPVAWDTERLLRLPDDAREPDRLREWDRDFERDRDRDPVRERERDVFECEPDRLRDRDRDFDFDFDFECDFERDRERDNRLLASVSSGFFSFSSTLVSAVFSTVSSSLLSSTSSSSSSPTGSNCFSLYRCIRCSVAFNGMCRTISLQMKNVRKMFPIRSRRQFSHFVFVCGCPIF